MARRSRSTSASRSPSVNQSRSASTMAAPARPMAPPAPVAAAPQQPGLFGQMASIAGGVAVGSAVGNVVGAGISSMFGGSEAPQQQQAAPQPAYYQYSQEQHGADSCSAHAKSFTNCLEQSNNDMSACQYYLDMLKQCQSFASQRF